MACCCQCGDKSAIESISSNEQLSGFDEIIKKYTGVEGSLITVLQKVQDLYGYLPIPVLDQISERLGVKRAKIYGVVTFYAQFRLNPMGKHVIMLCQGTACHVNGSEKIETALCDELGVEVGETTEDGVFTLDEAACLGCCSLAPVMMVDGLAYGPLTPDKARNIIREIYSKEKESDREEVEA